MARLLVFPPSKLNRIFFFWSFSALVLEGADTPDKFNVRDYGAVGDGKKLDTAAIQKAIDAAALTSGEVDFPAGTYLTGSLDLKSHVTLNLDKDAVIQGSSSAKDYPIITARWEGIERPCHRALISADEAEDITIQGSGTISGNSKVGQMRNPRGPTVVEPISCKNVHLDGVTLMSSSIWTLHPTYCQNVTISNMTFKTRDWSSDGIDIDSCQTVLIDLCTFHTGDDSIAIKSGKGQEGVKMGRACEDITITNCTFLKGYSSIAFGSELSGGIHRVKISNCTFKNGRAALYLKSCPGRAGEVSDIEADHLIVGPEPLLEIQTNYGYNKDSQGVPGLAGLTKFDNITVSNVTLKSKNPVKIQATSDNPVDSLTLSDISGKSARGFILCDIKNLVLKNIDLTGVFGAHYLTQDVQGTGLDGAVPYVTSPTSNKGTSVQ